MAGLVGTRNNPEADKLPAYPWFDWLRLAMASAVVFQHFSLTPWQPMANLAVRVFFALSGWLIGGILLRTTPAELPRFFYNRGTRIWIPYALAVAMIYGLAALRDGPGYHWARHLFYDLTFTHNWFSLRPDFARAVATMPLEGSGNHFWSIAVEEQFYLLAPLLILFLPLARIAWFWIAGGLLLAALGWNAAPIAFGVAAAIMEARRPGWSQGPAARLAVVATLVLSGAAMLLVEPSYAYVSPFFSIALVLLSAVPGRRNEVGEFFGGLSYPLYLIHVIGAFIVHFITKRSIGALAQPWDGLLSFVVALVAAAVFYLLIDRNIQRHRGRLFTPARGRAFMAAAYLLAVVGMTGGGLYVLLREPVDFPGPPPSAVGGAATEVVGSGHL